MAADYVALWHGPDRALYYQTDHWQWTSLLKRARDANCKSCGSGDRLHAHHRHYRTIGRERMDDLVTLCAGCHAFEHGAVRTSLIGDEDIPF